MRSVISSLDRHGIRSSRGAGLRDIASLHARERNVARTYQTEHGDAQSPDGQSIPCTVWSPLPGRPLHLVMLRSIPGSGELKYIAIALPP